MRVVLAYITIVFIWSTTPLAIQWSSQEIDFLLSVCLRMVFAVAVLLPILFWKDKCLPMNQKAVYSYLSGALGMCVAMGLAYWAAQYVESALISVVFGLTPLVTGLQAYFILGEALLIRHVFAVMTAVLGLLLMFVVGEKHEGGIVAQHIGLVLLLISVFSYGLSNVLIKFVRAKVSPLQQTTGSLLVTSMGFVMLCLVFDVSVPPVNHIGQEIGIKTIVCLLYLAFIGSACGFFLLYFVLGQLSAGAVSLITLMTPVFALLLGHYLNNEQVDVYTLLGSVLIGVGLIMYEWRTLLKFLRFKQKPRLRYV